jgi:hypothetical protein
MSQKPYRSYTYVAIFSYASKSGQAGTVAKYNERVDAWISAWNLTIPQQRVLHSLVAEVLGKDLKQASLALIFRVKYLDTFRGEEYPPEVLVLATAALLNGVNSPVTSFKDRNALLEVSTSAYLIPM